MNKLEMAHEWYMKHSESPSFMDTEIRMAWDYADAMQAEAEKREDKSRPDVLNEVQYMQQVLDNITKPADECDHEWVHISAYGVKADYYICRCGAKHP